MNSKNHVEFFPLSDILLQLFLRTRTLDLISNNFIVKHETRREAETDTIRVSCVAWPEQPARRGPAHLQFILDSVFSCWLDAEK